MIGGTPTVEDSAMRTRQKTRTMAQMPVGRCSGTRSRQLPANNWKPIRKPVPYTACAPEALAAIPTGNRAGAAVDKLLPLLESPDSAARVAAARALAAIPPGDRAGRVIDKLLPLLESPDRQVQAAAAEAASIPVKD
jgi:HEAT repeats